MVNCLNKIFPKALYHLLKPFHERLQHKAYALFIPKVILSSENLTHMSNFKREKFSDFVEKNENYNSEDHRVSIIM